MQEGNLWVRPGYRRTISRVFVNFDRSLRASEKLFASIPNAQPPGGTDVSVRHSRERGNLVWIPGSRCAWPE